MNVQGIPSAERRKQTGALVKGVVQRILARGGFRLQRITPSSPATHVVSPLEHNSQQNVDQIYSDPAQVSAYISPERLQFYQSLVSVLIADGLDLNEKSVADVGCGTGHLLLNLSRAFTPATLTGFDFSREALRVAAEVVPQGHFEYLDIYAPIDRAFDVVFCTEVLEHLLHPDSALANVIHLVRPGGFAFLTVPNGRTDTFNGHINFWSPESWPIFVRAVCTEHDVTTGSIEGDVNYAVVRTKEGMDRR